MPKIKYKDKSFRVAKGTLIGDFLKAHEPEQPLQIVAVFLEYALCSLNTPVTRDARIDPVYINSVHGLRVYERTINLVMTRIGKKLFPDDQLHLKFSLNKGVYCEFEKHKPLYTDNLKAIEDLFEDFIKVDHTISKGVFSKSAAVKILEKQNDHQKLHLTKFHGNNKITFWGLDDYWSYFTGPLMPSTSYLNKFEIMSYEDGFIVRFPDLIATNELPPYENQRKIFHVYTQFSRWLDLLDIKDSCQVNEMIHNGRFSDYIKMCEAIQEKEISDIADSICNTNPRPRLVLISGPSSSGKTTFSKRLGIQLRVNGVRPLLISLDNYYLDRDKMSKLQNGKLDLESLHALDLDKFNGNILDLLKGKPTEIPLFSFVKGERLPKGKEVNFGENEVIIVEGIHGLNPELTQQIPAKEKFRIYVSPLTQVPIDNSNRFPTATNRLLRRIIRDSKYRGYPPEKTIDMWQSVREGEERNIFPFQENADILFNSALMYELNVFRPIVYPLLEKISHFEKEFADSEYLLELMRYYQPYSTDEIPPTSILREFIGKSSFNYKS